METYTPNPVRVSYPGLSDAERYTKQRRFARTMHRIEQIDVLPPIRSVRDMLRIKYAVLTCGVSPVALEARYLSDRYMRAT